VRFAVKVRARRVLHSALTLHLLQLLGERGIGVYQNFPYHETTPAPQEPAEPTPGDGAAPGPARP